jgi:hypothetical protein
MEARPRLWVYEYKAWSGYLVSAIAPYAARVEATLDDDSGRILASVTSEPAVFIFHINLTHSHRMPHDRQNLIAGLDARNILLRNSTCTDISKRAVQRYCVEAGLGSVTASREGDPDELLIVKTDYNFGGLRESELTEEELRRLGYVFSSHARKGHGDEYAILRRSEIQPNVWTSTHWVVEKYISNSEHKFYRIYISGESIVVSRVIDRSNFKKMPEGITRSSTFMQRSDLLNRCGSDCSDDERAASEAVRLAQEAGIDFAALDAVVDDAGGLYFVDVNTTPYWGDGGHPDLLAHLGSGLIGAP